jgi:hypothetical protein
MPEARTKPRKSAVKPPTAETETTARDTAVADTGATVSRDEIARRAYDIAHGDDAGSDEENWLRAEKELRGSSTTSG